MDVSHACSWAEYRTRSGDDHEPDTAANKPSVSRVVACERHIAVPLSAPVVALLD